MKRRPASIPIGLLVATLATAASASPLPAQEREPPAEPTEAAPEPVDPAAPQEGAPPIGLVEFFGLRETEEDSLRAPLGLGAESGADVPASAPVVEWGSLPLLAARLLALPAVAEARFETVCCHQGNTVLFIGIRERGAEPRGDHWPEPEGEVRLPDRVLAAHRDFIEALDEAVRGGPTGEDLSRGHVLVADSAARSHQLRFPALAREHLPTLREVLRSGADPEERAVAAALIGYAQDKAAVAPELTRALRDPDPSVRNNAARSLAAIAVYAGRTPEANVEIPIEALVEMLGSVVWTDRNRALALLTYLAAPGDEEILRLLRGEALPELVEMARWRSPGHAMPAFILLGRIAGLSDQETLQAWQEDRREEVIERAASAAGG